MKNWFYAALTAAFIFAAPEISAQKHYEQPAITPELTAEADAALQAYKAAPDDIKVL